MSGAVDIDAALAHHFGHRQFLPLQRDAIEAVLAGDNVLTILPTGGGKSLCYQLPALCRPGLTVVVSPLIALMREQAERLRARKISAGALNSAMDGGEMLAVERAIEERRLKLLYVAPERFALPGLIELLQRGGANLLAVDEAHCISQWGHEFRPEYRGLRDVALRLGDIQTLAVTASANAATRADISAQLFARPPREIVASFDRPNLRIAFARGRDPARQIAEFVDARRGQCGIVYARSRRRAERFAHMLAARGHRAIAYHAGLDAITRHTRQDEFGRTPGVVMCATIAFGLGIDKSDVRFVCHADTPGSVEAWYQEIGRAGRDGAPADTLTLWRDGDLPELNSRTRDARAMRALCSGVGCRRQALLAYFGEVSQPCGQCDNCRQGFARAANGVLRSRVASASRIVATEIGRILTGKTTETWRRQAENLPIKLVRSAFSPLARFRNAPGPLDPDELETAPLPAWSPPTATARLSIDELRLLGDLRACRLRLARGRRALPASLCADSTLIAWARARPRDVNELAASAGLSRDAILGDSAAFLDVISAHRAQ